MADTAKEDALQTVQLLQAQDIEVYMVTGDNARTAQAIASQVLKLIERNYYYVFLFFIHPASPIRL